MSSSLRSATLTERKPPPTGVVIGPLRATPFRRIDSSVCSGRGLPPNCSITSAPACCTSHSNSTPVASSTRRVASVSSGPVPSPGMRVTLCAIASRVYVRLLARPFGYRPSRNRRRSEMTDVVYRPGLEGIVAVETEIAEPDRAGGSLRYRGVDIEELVGRYPFEQVWGLLVDEAFEPGLPPARSLDVRRFLTGRAPADVQAVTAHLGAEWRLGQLIDIDDEQA